MEMLMGEWISIILFYFIYPILVCLHILKIVFYWLSKVMDYIYIMIISLIVSLEPKKPKRFTQKKLFDA